MHLKNFYVHISFSTMQADKTPYYVIFLTVTH